MCSRVIPYAHLILVQLLLLCLFCILHINPMLSKSCSSIYINNSKVLPQSTKCLSKRLSEEKLSSKCLIHCLSHCVCFLCIFLLVYLSSCAYQQIIGKPLDILNPFCFVVLFQILSNSIGFFTVNTNYLLKFHQIQKNQWEQYFVYFELDFFYYYLKMCKVTY